MGPKQLFTFGGSWPQ